KSAAFSDSSVGPRPAIWLGSIRTARASSSSLNSRSSPKASICSNAGETKSGGGCVGLGNRLGSYRWYVWMTPPRESREGIFQESEVRGQESVRQGMRTCCGDFALG